jgi:hypothetical protein
MKLNAYYSITNLLRSEVQECLFALESNLINGNSTDNQENLINEVKMWSIRLAEAEAASAVLQKYFGEAATNTEQRVIAEKNKQ